MALSEAKRASDKRHQDKLDVLKIQTCKSKAVRKRMERDNNDKSRDD